MKIGILTLLLQQNYGGVLQAYALQKSLEQSNIKTEVLKYWLTPNNNYLYGYYQNKKIHLYRRILSLLIHSFKNDLIYQEYLRRKRTIKFINKYILTSPYDYRNQDELLNETRYDSIIVGSDQVWKPNSSRINAFLLYKMVKNIKKIAYAASYGIEQFPNESLKLFQDALNDFKYISCREKSGVKITKDIIHKDTEWVLDPVLLLEQKAWNSLIKTKRRSNYIFFYWLGKIDKLIYYLKQYKNKKIVLCLTNYIGYDINNEQLLTLQKNHNIHFALDAGPIEFLRYLANADEVISDSFHAMALSIVFEKQFGIIINTDNGRLGMRSRMEDLARRLGLTEYICENEVPQSIKTINYKIVNNILIDWRELSLKFLMNSINN